MLVRSQRKRLTFLKCALPVMVICICLRSSDLYSSQGTKPDSDGIFTALNGILAIADSGLVTPSTNAAPPPLEADLGDEQPPPNDAYKVEGGPKYDAMVAAAYADPDFQRVKDSLQGLGYQLYAYEFGIQWDDYVNVTLVVFGYVSPGGGDTICVGYYNFPTEHSYTLVSSKREVQYVAGKLYRRTGTVYISSAAATSCFQQLFDQYVEPCQRLAGEPDIDSMPTVIMCVALAWWNAAANCARCENCPRGPRNYPRNYP